MKKNNFTLEEIVGIVLLAALLGFACWRAYESDAAGAGILVFLAAYLAYRAVKTRRERLERENVSLTPLTEAHLEEVSVLWSNPKVVRYTAIGRPLKREAAEEKLHELLESQRGLAGPTVFAVLQGQGFCGIVGCPPVDAERREFGIFFQLLQECWRHGTGRKAAELALERLEALYPDATVYAEAREENTASIRILGHLGFQATEGDGLLEEAGTLRFVRRPGEQEVRK